MSVRAWSALDRATHALYVPTMLGRRSARSRWHHHLHLIPRRLMRVVCDRYDHSLGVYDDPDDPRRRKSAADRLDGLRKRTRRA